MICARVYDFIGGTTVRLPRRRPKPSNGKERWDILRPNRRAAELVARHFRTLQSMHSVPAE